MEKKGIVCFQGAIMLTGEYMVCLVVGYKMIILKERIERSIDDIFTYMVDSI